MLFTYKMFSIFIYLFLHDLANADLKTHLLT